MVCDADVDSLDDGGDPSASAALADAPDDGDDEDGEHERGVDDEMGDDEHEDWDDTGHAPMVSTSKFIWRCT